MTASDPANLPTYQAQEVAAHYAGLDYLTPCERLLFETYIPVESAILDLGVGGGRTTGFLAARASRYVGVDYSSAMVKACQDKFPGLEFVTADAADLSIFRDGSFDAVVFSFNGIDYVLPEDRRRSSWEHVYRVLKPGGRLIFSCHNPRAVLVRRSWNRERVMRIAQKCSFGSKILCGAAWVVLAFLRATLAFGQTIAASAFRALKRIPTRMFWRGEGTLLDSAHGGLLTHYATPRHVKEELAAFAFQPVRVLGDDYPQSSHILATDWYYYVFSK